MTSPIQLTFANQALLSGIEMQTPTRFTFRGAMGDRVEGWVLKPYGFQPGQTYPVANLVHGGFELHSPIRSSFHPSPPRAHPPSVPRAAGSMTGAIAGTLSSGLATATVSS